MRQERYTVIADATGSEYSWHYTLDKASRVADKYAAEDGGVYRVDLAVMEGNPRDGFECIDADPDLYSTEVRS